MTDQSQREASSSGGHGEGLDLTNTLIEKISVDPAQPLGGQIFELAVKLTKVAPQGGIKIDIAADRPDLIPTLPPALIVPEGQLGTYVKLQAPKVEQGHLVRLRFSEANTGQLIGQKSVLVIPEATYVEEMKSLKAVLQLQAAEKTQADESPAERSEPGRVKLTVNIPEREMAALRRIAERRDMSLTDVIRRAIAMEEFIEQVDREGGKLLVEQRDRSIRQLVLR